MIRLPHIGWLAWVAVLLVSAPVAAQPRASLSGFVRDAETGETLLLASVILHPSERGTATNNAGFYTLSGLEPGEYTVVASYIGYRTLREEVTLAPGEQRRLALDLVPAHVTTGEVVVTAEDDLEEEVRRLGVAQLSTDLVKQLPTVLEPDVFRSLQLLPGVQTASDFSTGLYIRGGSPDQTLILLDRNTVYSPGHIFGFFSVFNPDAIKDVRLYKGGYPASYGGRLGAVVDIYNKDGNRNDISGTASVGLLAARAMVEGPLQVGAQKGSFMLAARRSTLEPVLAVLEAQEIEGTPSRFNFYDINGKLNFDASPDDRLSLALYAGHDVFALPLLEEDTLDVAYGNQILSLNWTHLFSNRLFSNFTLAGTRFSSAPTLVAGSTPFDRRNEVYDLSVKGSFEWVPNGRHALEAGFWSGLFTVDFRECIGPQLALDRCGVDEQLSALYSAAYVQETFSPSPRWMVRVGVRASYFDRGRYLRWEPRLTLEYRPLPRIRLQAGYGRYYQFLTLSASEFLTGFDVWLPADEGVPPAFSDQFVAGVKTSLTETLDLDVEGYYFSLHDLFETNHLVPDRAGIRYVDRFRFGKGYAYGAEVLLRKAAGRLNGFLGYTFGQARRRFPGVRDGAYFAPKHDRTHDLTLFANYKVGQRWRLTSVLKFATGQAYTRPHAQYELPGYPFDALPFEVLQTDFNNARLPAYHRLDLGAARTGRFFGFAEYELLLQVLNVYNRRNVWFYLFEFKPGGVVERTTIPQLPVPLPNVSLTLNF